MDDTFDLDERRSAAPATTTPALPGLGEVVRPRRSLPLLTTSSAACFRACPRLYEFTYEQLYRPAHTPDALAFGDRAHLGLETWWSFLARMVAVGQPAPQEAIFAALGTIDQEADPFRREAARALMIGHHLRWADMTYLGEPIEVLAVEREFSGPLLNPATRGVSKTWLRGGKLDVLVRVAGRVYIVEHKTTSEDFSAGSDYRRRLRLNSQISNYHVGARLLGYPDVAGVIYDVLGKAEFRQKKATPPESRRYTIPSKKSPTPRLYAGQREADETVEEYGLRVGAAIASAPDDYFARFEVVRLADEETEAARDVWQTGEEIKDARRLSRWPRNTAACGRHGRTCDFLPACEGTASLTDGTRYRRAARPHEELAEPWAAE